MSEIENVEGKPSFFSIHYVIRRLLWIEGRGNMMQESDETKHLDVGKRIAFYRQKREMSQTELSEKSNCSLEDIQQVEGDFLAKQQRRNGIWSVENMDFLFTIADALNLDIPVFFLPMNDENFEKYRTDK